MAISETHIEGDHAALTVTMRKFHPGWMIALGVLTSFTGLAALVFPLASTLAVELMIGGLFLAVGVSTTVHAVMERKVDGMWWELLMGFVYTVAGILFLANPFGGIVALTVMLGTTFVAEGVLRIVMATQMGRSRQLFLMVASGALSMLLGVIVLGGLANGASLTLVGFLLGINFVFAGTATIALGVAALRSDEQKANH